MTISHKISRRLPNWPDYNMDYFTVEMKSEELPEELRKEVPMAHQWRIMEYIVQREAVSVQVQDGVMSVSEAQARLDYLRSLLLKELADKVVQYGL
jgi:hypothetical protein